MSCVLDKMRHFNSSLDPLVKQHFSQYDANLSLFISTCKTVDSCTWFFPYLFLIRSQATFSQKKKGQGKIKQTNKSPNNLVRTASKEQCTTWSSSGFSELQMYSLPFHLVYFKCFFFRLLVLWNYFLHLTARILPLRMLLFIENISATNTCPFCLENT